PVLAAIQSDGYAAVVRGDHAPRILGIDPQPMVVAMGNFYFVEEMAAVSGFEGLHIHHIDNVFVFRVGNDVHVIPRTLPQAVAGVDEVPGFAAIIGAIESAVGIARLNQGIDTIGAGPHRDPDASIRSFRKTVLFKALPGRAAVTGAI